MEAKSSSSLVSDDVALKRDLSNIMLNISSAYFEADNVNEKFSLSHSCGH